MNFYNLEEALENPDKVTKLELGRKSIQTIHKEIGNLINLEYLDLKDNLIETLPKELGNLSNLNFLDLTYNPLINPCHQLINVFYNRIVRINDGIISYPVNPVKPISNTTLKVYI